MGEKLIRADEALRKLLEGNGRFVKGQPASPRRSPEDFRELAEAKYPKAVIVTCADSRVAPEILFDVGVGDIFVERVAGQRGKRRRRDGQGQH
jgi:carbonic anhydrase